MTSGPKRLRIPISFSDSLVPRKRGEKKEIERRKILGLEDERGNGKAYASWP